MMPKDKQTIPVAMLVLVIFHLVGFYGLAFSRDPHWYRALTPLNLLLTVSLLFTFHRSWNQGFFLFAAGVVLVSFFAEVLGVHTGLLFGHYRYGGALGPKVWAVPLLIAGNWLLLVYCTGMVVQPLPLPAAGKVLLAAGLMVFLDMLIEPVAAVLDFWTWQDYRIPASNYWGWFGVAALLQLGFQRADFTKQNPLAWIIFLLQVLFFLGLNLAL